MNSFLPNLRGRSYFSDLSKLGWVCCIFFLGFSLYNISLNTIQVLVSTNWLQIVCRSYVTQQLKPYATGESCFSSVRLFWLWDKRFSCQGSSATVWRALLSFDIFLKCLFVCYNYISSSDCDVFSHILLHSTVK